MKRKTDLEILLTKAFEAVQKYWKFLLSKWIIICVFGFGGSGIGLVIALLSKPTYKAHLSFTLIDNASGGSGLAALASSFGFGSFGSSNDAFSGENLLEILRSRYALEKTLLAPVDYNGRKNTMADVYIEINELQKGWKKSKNIELRSLSFPVNQNRASFSRTQDSILNVFYEGIVKSEALSIQKKDKKTGVVYVDFTSTNELFSKLFVEKLMHETYLFFTETRTSQSRANIEMMEAKADSIKRLYESALYKGASITQLNLNAAYQTAAVPRVKQEYNAQLYATVYAEVLKNLETLKLDLARQTPLVQIIDTPMLPLKKEKIGKAKGMILGGLMGGIFICLYLLLSNYFKGFLKNMKDRD